MISIEDFKRIPVNDRIMVIANCLHRHREDGALLRRVATSFSAADFLNKSSVWDETPQGHDYWDSLHRKLYRIDELWA